MWDRISTEAVPGISLGSHSSLISTFGGWGWGGPKMCVCGGGSLQKMYVFIMISVGLGSCSLQPWGNADFFFFFFLNADLKNYIKNIESKIFQTAVFCLLSPSCHLHQFRWPWPYFKVTSLKRSKFAHTLQWTSTIAWKVSQTYRKNILAL